MPNVTQYVQQDGIVPFQKWFDALGVKAALKVRTATAQMEAGNFGDHKSVGEGVWERRIHFEKGYRIYFAKDGEELVLLLCGGTKTRQQSDIDKAQVLWLEYKARKKMIIKQQELRNPASESKQEPKQPRRNRK